MEIRLEKIGKKFNTEWIFRNIDFVFEENSVTAVLGRNGSGKSTFLQILCGSLLPTTGTVSYHHRGKTIPDTEIFRHLALVAPYQELIEEFTLKEVVDFHFAFKRILPGYDKKKVIGILGFDNIGRKHIRQFSSGMKQRVKLILALLSDVPLLLLDEPTMNLDAAGIEWYRQMVSELSKDRTLVICSNQHQTESNFAKKSLMIEDFKT
ncbi:MAG: ATP-binding cassette domain-containing protein [bacterium]